MLNDKETSIFVGADHEWIVTILGRRARVLATKVNEVWPVLIGPVLVVHPVALLVGRLVLKTEVVHVIIEPQLIKPIEVYVGQEVGINLRFYVGNTFGHTWSE